ncbi:MAG: DUF1573 domain-containing protein [Armatimonadota bacterium]|nr:DUF1573 domain-containing protein [Armatimonadota bacterium]
MKIPPYVIILLLSLSLMWLPRDGYPDCAGCSSNDRLCGPNCLLVICDKLKVECSIEEIVTLSGTDKRGSTLTGVSNAAKAKRLEAVGMKIGADELAGLRTPAIAHLWRNHFVVVEADGAGSLKLTDPPAQPKVVSVSDFQKTYSGFALLIAKDKNLFPKPEAKGPDLRADSYTWDFGTAEEGTRLEHTFLCSNVGVEELVISKLDSTCGCTAATSSLDRIPPGGKAEIKVALDTTGRRGAQGQTVYIHSNDPITPTVQLQVSGAVWPSRLAYSPRSITFGEVRRGQNVSKEVFLPRSEARPFEIEKASCDIPFLTAGVTAREDKTGHVVKLDLRTDEAPLGELKGNVTIYTNHPKDPKVTVSVTATIKGDIDVFPDTLFFGLLKKGSSGHRKLALSTVSERPLKIERIDSPFDFLKVWAVPKVAGKEYELVAVLQRNAPTGYIKSEVVVHTDDPRQSEIKLPVYALIEE